MRLVYIDNAAYVYSTYYAIIVVVVVVFHIYCTNIKKGNHVYI